MRSNSEVEEISIGLSKSNYTYMNFSENLITSQPRITVSASNYSDFV